MMIFGDKKKAVNAILGPTAEHQMDKAEIGSMHAMMEELIDAMHMKDIPAAVEAFKAMFAECDAEPHREGPHIDGE
jgi:hypothetical protein